ncbi:cathepsin B-like [Paramacrobiotus metropolitanus]|uniref:cathepsin B-like n=1 Tax=Paramacrobiotus metropolitanus TaxID=2943436 RepID=UPI0024465D78|nr:cathepsin B-like [Paramacrobiotus metropolitanus]
MGRFLVLLFGLIAFTAAVDVRKDAGNIPPPGVKRITGAAAKKLPRFDDTSVRRAAIPECFDARQKWPNCKSISEIRDQGGCGTCWAVSSSSVMSDRLCIASGQKNNTFVSAMNVAACSVPGRSPQSNCKEGSEPTNAYKLAITQGVLSGGSLESNAGCQPYPVKPNEEKPLTCSKTCTNTGARPDKYTIEGFWTMYDEKPSPEQIKKNVANIQRDIFANGPVVAVITVYGDFSYWRNYSGAYRGPTDAQDTPLPMGHAVRLIGWCKDQKGVPYWLMANSWGTARADGGVWWIEMGKNVIGIEDHVSAPIVKLPNTCGSLCDTAFDQIVRFKPGDNKSKVYVFQGGCTTEVTVAADGKITPVGKPGPIAKTFMGLPAPPIRHWKYYPQIPNALSLGNPNGAGGLCELVAGTKKYSCPFGQDTPPDASSAAKTQLANGDKYIYYTDVARSQQIYKFPANDPDRGYPVSIGTTLSSKFKQVTSLLDIDGTKMLVCGKDSADKPACGTLAIDSWQLTGPTPLKKSVTKC